MCLLFITLYSSSTCQYLTQQVWLLGEDSKTMLDGVGFLTEQPKDRSHTPDPYCATQQKGVPHPFQDFMCSGLWAASIRCRVCSPQTPQESPWKYMAFSNTKQSHCSTGAKLLCLHRYWLLL